MGADDLAVKTGVDQVRHPADMVDMGMGEEKIVDCAGCGRKGGKGQHRVVALGGAAVDHEGDVVWGARAGLHQVAGAGDAVFCAEMGDFHLGLLIWDAEWSPDFDFARAGARQISRIGRKPLAGDQLRNSRHQPSTARCRR